MSSEAETVVSDFCKAWARLNIDQVMDFFTEDATYHNIPLPVATGKAAIRKTIEGLLKGTTWLEFKVLHTASGKIKAWRDYFDMKMFTDQMT
jgi:limonene-1,2-epoxide hydrolase